MSYACIGITSVLKYPIITPVAWRGRDDQATHLEPKAGDTWSDFKKTTVSCEGTVLEQKTASILNAQAKWTYSARSEGGRHDHLRRGAQWEEPRHDAGHERDRRPWMAQALTGVLSWGLYHFVELVKFVELCVWHGCGYEHDSSHSFTFTGFQTGSGQTVV